MSKTKPQRFKVADVEMALRASHGIYTGAAEILAQKYGSCAPNTVKAYVLRHPKLQALRQELDDEMLDVGESKLFEAVIAGSERSVHYLLSTRGKHRGYSQRIESTGPDGGAIEYRDMSARELLVSRIAALAARSEADGAAGEPDGSAG